MSRSDEVLFRDGLGERILIRDDHGRPASESLLIRHELTSIPSFEFALNERIWALEQFDRPAFLTIRNIVRAPGRLPSISLVHDVAPGTRLSEVLARAKPAGLPTAGAAFFVLKELLDGLAELHRQSGDLAHGAIAPERIILANGRVRIADYALGSALESLRYTPERYWKELRVAAGSSAGGVRLDRPVDVAQAAMVAVAMLAGRPLGDNEPLAGLGDLLASLTLPQSIRAWMLKALHMDPRRVFVHAGEAGRALDEAFTEAGINPASRDLEFMTGASDAVERPAPTLRPVASRPVAAPPPRPAPAAVKPALVAPAPRRDVRPMPDVEVRQTIWQEPTMARRREPASAGFRRTVWAAAVVLMMTCAFTAAQYIPPPEWLFSNSGTLVVESNPQGVPVSVNGNAHGVTPLALKVQAGVHEVELRGPGRPRIFKVHVTRGDRVAQYIEFVRR